MSFLGTVGRVGLGIGTGGTSELANAASGGGLYGSNGVFSGGGPGGGGLANMLGIQNNYNAGNIYGQGQIQQDVNQQEQIYGQQQNLAQALQAQMNGQGPNPAQVQYQANQEAGLANAQGMIASQRGLNPALAARMGANAAAQSNQQSSMGSALLNQQQQLGATANLGNLYGQMQQGNLGQQQLYSQQSLGTQGINSGVASGNTANNTKLIGGLISGAGSAAAAAAAHGALIPGQANVPGDSPQNDTVHAMLSPGEIVVPRSMAHDPEKAKEFIDHLLKEKSKSKVGYGDVLKSRKKAA